ncbi:MAG: glycosyl transferase, partial [Beijerinckiaceae bacterium]
AALSWPGRSAAWARPLLDRRGILLAVLIVLPWFVAIAWKSGGAFFQEAVGKDMLAKVGSGQEKHGGPPGLYAAIFPWTFWPGSIIALLAIPFIWANRRDDVVRLCLAWIVPSWLVFEAVPTKLPHYVLPLYIAVAVLAVRALVLNEAYIARGWRTAVGWLLPVIPAAFAAAAVGATILLEPPGFAKYIPLAVAAPLLLVAIGLAWAAMRALRGEPGVAVAPVVALASVALGWSVYQFAWPALRSIQLSPRLAEAVRAAPCTNPLIATVGDYREPSLVFLTRTDLAVLLAADGAEFMLAGGCRVAFVDSTQERAFNDALAAKGASARLLTRVEGVNINRALQPRSMALRRVDIGVYLRDTSRP